MPVATVVKEAAPALPILISTSALAIAADRTEYTPAPPTVTAKPRIEKVAPAATVVVVVEPAAVDVVVPVPAVVVVVAPALVVVVAAAVVVVVAAVVVVVVSVAD